MNQVAREPRNLTRRDFFKTVILGAEIFLAGCALKRENSTQPTPFTKVSPAVLTNQVISEINKLASQLTDAGEFSIEVAQYYQGKQLSLIRPFLGKLELSGYFNSDPAAYRIEWDTQRSRFSNSKGFQLEQGARPELGRTGTYKIIEWATPVIAFSRSWLSDASDQVKKLTMTQALGHFVLWPPVSNKVKEEVETTSQVIKNPPSIAEEQVADTLLINRMLDVPALKATYEGATALAIWDQITDLMEDGDPSKRKGLELTRYQSLYEKAKRYKFEPGISFKDPNFIEMAFFGRGSEIWSRILTETWPDSFEKTARQG